MGRMVHRMTVQMYCMHRYLLPSYIIAVRKIIRVRTYEQDIVGGNKYSLHFILYIVLTIFIFKLNLIKFIKNLTTFIASG